jgi:preprotein translocase subunit SecG
METYIPTDPTMVIIWPLVAVFFVLSVGLAYIWEAMQ